MESANVSIHYMPSDGYAWATYIGQKLEEYSINCELCDFTAETKSDVKNYKVNAFFVTPDFLECGDWTLLKAFIKNSCILVLTGTDQVELELVLEKKCDNIQDYFIYEMKENDKSVRDLLIFIISKYEEDETPASPVPGLGHRPISSSVSLPIHFKYRKGDGPSEDYYDFLPRPVQVNRLKDIIYKDGTLYILLERKAEGKVTVQTHDETYSPLRMEYGVYEMPYEDQEATEMTVIQDGKSLGHMLIDVTQVTDAISRSASDPSVQEPVLQASVSEHDLQTKLEVHAVSVETQTNSSDLTSESPAPDPHSRSHMSIYMNTNEVRQERESTHSESDRSRPRNKLEQIRQLLEEETDPEEILCQCLGIEKGIRELDKKMTSLVQRVGSVRVQSCASRRSSNEEESIWPTLIHFGAEYNLRNFCDALLSNQLLRGACLQPNKDGNLPHDIARLKGHHELANMLKSFSEQERDSGISGTSSLSQSSAHNEPPAPHLSGWRAGSEYIPMGGEDCEEFSEEDEYMMMKGHQRQASDSTERTLTPPFKEMLKMQDAIDSGSDKGSPFVTDDDSDQERHHHHKDLSNLLGMKDEDTISVDHSRKPKSKFMTMFKKSERSRSEPSVCADGLTLTRSKSSKSYFRNSRSSASSSGSTLSDELNEVTLRGSRLTYFGKKLTSRFLETAKKRKSARIKHALGDQHDAVPSLPTRSFDSNEKF